MTTDQLIVAHSRDTLRLSRAQKAQSRMSPVLLAWSISQRVSHDVIMQAAIECVTSLLFLNLFSYRVTGLGEAVSEVYDQV
jgi:hypothetical protein